MDISDSLTYHITKTGNILRRLVAKKIRDAGINITPEESVLLNQLWGRDNQSQADLGAWSVKEPSTLTRQIDGLVKKGYVTRRQSVHDRRSVSIRLTASGRALNKRFAQTGVGELDAKFAQIIDSDSKKIVEQLLKIRQAALLDLEKD